MSRGDRIECCEPFHPLDKLLGLECRVLCLPNPLAMEVKPPRSRHFIVLEEAEHMCNDQGRYTLFIMAKRGLDTLNAVRLLARSLNVHPRLVGYAGLKDADATTLQFITIAGHYDKIIELHLQRDRMIYLKPLCKVKEPLRRGMLRGNSFTIVLKGVDKDALKDVLKLDESNIVLLNYYGYQRFGTIRPLTHVVGYYAALASLGALVREAALAPYPDESPSILSKRVLGRVDTDYEALIIEGVKLGLVHAIESLPKGLRELFASALQAYLFNRYLSLRVKLGYSIRDLVPGEILREGTIYAPIPSFQRPKGVAGEIYDEVLRAEGLTWSDLKTLSRVLRVKVKPSLRPLTFRPINTKILFRGEEAVLRFTLPPGSYATIVLREFIADPLRFT